jgi:hypothetical protein
MQRKTEKGGGIVGWYWTVSRGSGGGGYNDPQYYRIIDGNKKIILEATTDRDTLQKICDAHNKCCIELVNKGGEGNDEV